MAKAQVTVPLDIPDVRVLKTELSKDGELIITIESTKAGTTCRVCGHRISKSVGEELLERFVTLSTLCNFLRMQSQ